MESQAQDLTTDDLLLGLGIGSISLGSYLLLGLWPTMLIGGGALVAWQLYEHRDDLHLTEPAEAEAPVSP